MHDDPDRVEGFHDTGGYYDTYCQARRATTGPTTAPRCGLAGGQRWRLPDLQAVVGRWRQGPAGTPAGTGGPEPVESPGGLGRVLSRAEVDDSVIRAIASPRQQKLNQVAIHRTTAARSTRPAEHRRGPRETLGWPSARLPRFPPWTSCDSLCPWSRLAQDGAGHLHPACAGRRHLRSGRRSLPPASSSCAFFTDFGFSLRAGSIRRS